MNMENFEVNKYRDRLAKEIREPIKTYVVPKHIISIKNLLPDY